MAKTAKQIIVIKVDKGFGNQHEFPIASGETIYEGTISVIGSDGYLYNLDSTAVPGTRLPVIVAEDTANVDGEAATTNAGSISGDLEEKSDKAGDKTVRRCYIDGFFKMTFSAITQSDVGKIVYATDNYTLDESQNSGCKIGTLMTYLSSTSGYVALNTYYNPSGIIKTKFALTAATTTAGGDVISWANPTGENIIINDVILDVTTKTSGAATMDVGVAANGSTSSDTLIDEIDIGSAAIVASCHTAPGTNGGADRKVTSSQYITGTPSASAAGLVGTCTILYWIHE